MAVYTDVSDTQLDAYLADYDLGELLAFKGIAEGVENSNFLLHTDAGYFILTLYEKRVAESDLPFFLGLMDHLAAGGINCPTPVKARDGIALRRLAERPAAIATFLDGMWVRRPTPAHCAALGNTLARMHMAGMDFSLARKNALSQADWRGLYLPSRDQADSIMPGLASLIDRELDALDQAWPGGLPQGVIHADLFPDNVFFLKDRLSGLIDFYFACCDSLAYDIAICLNAWCFERDNSFNITKGRALLSGYDQARALTGQEWAAMPVLARGAAVRFLLTRLHDWLSVPRGALVTPKDPLEFVAKLRFHQSVRSMSDYGIDP